MVTKNRLQSIEIKYNQSASPQIFWNLSSVFDKKVGDFLIRGLKA